MRQLFAKKGLIKTSDHVQRLLRKNKGSIKLNVGCGTDYKNKWINIDNNSDNNIEKLDLNWDLRNSLPFPENSVDYIYSEHFFEHLTVEEGLTTMRDMLRVLKPGGVMRVAMPDLEKVVDNYLHVPLKKDPVIKRHGITGVETPAQWINMSFREWGHKWLYDYEELERRLKEAGYSNIKRCKIQKSSHKELCGLESRPESYLIAEASK